MPTIPVIPVRELLRRYAAAWLSHPSGGGDPVVVDAFAGRDHPRVVAGEPEAVRAVREGTGRWVLVEEDPAKVAWLRAGVRSAGLAEGPGPGEVTLVEGTPESAGLPDLAVGAGRALYLLDPARPDQLSLATVLDLLAAEGADAAIRLPTASLRRLAGHGDTPLADLPPLARRTVEGWSRLLGDPRREWTRAWRDSLRERGVDEAVAVVAERFAGALREAFGPARWVTARTVEGGGEGGAEHVVLTSAEPARILPVNAALEELRRSGALPWGDEDHGLVRYRRTGVIELFGGGGEDRAREVDTPGLAHETATRFAGQTVEWRRVLADFLDTELRENDLRKALLELRRGDRARFRSLAQPDAEVAFPGDAIRPAPRGRARRPDPGAAELTLPLDDPDQPRPGRHTRHGGPDGP